MDSELNKQIGVSLMSNFRFSKKDKFWQYSKGENKPVGIVMRKLRDFIQNNLGIFIYKEDGKHNYGGEELFTRIEKLR